MLPCVYVCAYEFPFVAFDEREVDCEFPCDESLRYGNDNNKRIMNINEKKK